MIDWLTHTHISLQTETMQLEVCTISPPSSYNLQETENPFFRYFLSNNSIKKEKLKRQLKQKTKRNHVITLLIGPKLSCLWVQWRAYIWFCISHRKKKWIFPSGGTLFYSKNGEKQKLPPSRLWMDSSIVLTS